MNTTRQHSDCPTIAVSKKDGHETQVISYRPQIAGCESASSALVLMIAIARFGYCMVHHRVVGLSIGTRGASIACRHAWECLGVSCGVFCGFVSVWHVQQI